MIDLMEKLAKNCAVCGKGIRLILYRDRTYRGGHFFGKISLFTKKEIAKALKAGTRKTGVGGLAMDVLKKDPRPYEFAEYWECPKCYWG